MEEIEHEEVPKTKKGKDRKDKKKKKRKKSIEDHVKGWYNYFLFVVIKYFHNFIQSDRNRRDS